MNVLHELFGDPLKHAQTAKQAEPAGTTLSARQPQQGLLRSGLSLILATGAAYAFSFAVDLLVGGLIGIYPKTAFLPVATWSVISAVSILAARALSRCSRWLALPYAAFGALAVLGGMVGAHPHNFIVAAAMFLHTHFVWKASTRPTTQSHTPGASGSPRAKAGQWDALLSKCDLLMARDEIADMHRKLNAQAEREGGEYIFKNDYVAAWEAFRDNPNIGTARELLDVAPLLLQYFEMCSPGSSFYSTSRYLKERGL